MGAGATTAGGGTGATATAGAGATGATRSVTVVRRVSTIRWCRMGRIVRVVVTVRTVSTGWLTTCRVTIVSAWAAGAKAAAASPNTVHGIWIRMTYSLMLGPEHDPNEHQANAASRPA